QDATTATLARELHDEIINVNVRLNIRSIQTALDQPTTPALRAELETLLASEQNIAETLRVICERLHPSGLDDPLGLPNLLRLQTERAETIWPGECQLRVIGHLVPITEPQQREALRIVREGLNNAVKHADATSILVTLRYPTQTDDDITVIVEDNGRSGTTVRSRAGHRGIRGMHESAHAAGGRLWFERRESGGTRLVFAFPPQSSGAQTAEHYPGPSSVGESRYAQTTRS
ncbi:MAG: signal transduction histidine kinase, partial [Oscillochloris sp.]|nr:signal transduction histidine kinase [Oscillochloris sp.]